MPCFFLASQLLDFDEFGGKNFHVVEKRSNWVIIGEFAGCICCLGADRELWVCYCLAAMDYCNSCCLSRCAFDYFANLKVSHERQIGCACSTRADSYSSDCQYCVPFSTGVTVCWRWFPRWKLPMAKSHLNFFVVVGRPPAKSAPPSPLTAQCCTAVARRGCLVCICARCTNQANLWFVFDLLAEFPDSKWQVWPCFEAGVVWGCARLCFVHLSRSRTPNSWSLCPRWCDLNRNVRCARKTRHSPSFYP